jgi:hypothetical protein
VLQFLIVLAVLSAVVVVVMWPLRTATGRRVGLRSHPPSHPPSNQPTHPSELAELEAAREDKYREIRDAELDHMTGKLSDSDYELVDHTLRAEAVEILHRLDRARQA